MEIPGLRVPVLDPYSPAWRHLWLGTVLVILSWLAQLVLMIDGLATISARSGAGGFQTGLLELSLGLLSAAGWWLFATPDGTRDPSGIWGTKIVLRIALVLYAVVSVVMYARGSNGGTRALAEVVPQALLKSLAAITMFFCSVWLCRWTALRINDLRLAHFAVVCLWLIPILGVLGVFVVLATVLTLVVGQGAGDPPDVIGVTGYMVWGMVPVITACVVYLGLVCWLSCRLFAVRCEDPSDASY